MKIESRCFGASATIGAMQVCIQGYLTVRVIPRGGGVPLLVPLHAPVPPRKNNPPNPSKFRTWSLGPSSPQSHATTDRSAERRPPTTSRHHARIPSASQVPGPRASRKYIRSEVSPSLRACQSIATMTGRGGGGGRKVILPPMCVFSPCLRLMRPWSGLDVVLDRC